MDEAADTLTITNLEIRCPERGRKQKAEWRTEENINEQFGNKMPREGTETGRISANSKNFSSFGNKMPREGTETLHCTFLNLLNKIWK